MSTLPVITYFELTSSFAVVAIPEVEYHIHSELSTSPLPTSRRVGVPPPTKTRAGVSIPHQRRATSPRDRHVQIFDSQPLSSPPSRSGSLSGSLSTSIGGAASLHTQIQRLGISSPLIAASTLPAASDSALEKKTSAVESPSLSPVSPASPVSLLQSEHSSPPTSLGSHGTAPTGTSHISFLSITKVELKPIPEPTPSQEKDKTPDQIALPPSKEPDAMKEHQPSVQPIAIKPSLLSQTAPARVTRSTAVGAGLAQTHPVLSSLSPAFPVPLFDAPMYVKIADLGNASPSKKHYTEDIQTRQYRAPEAIIGRKDWGTRVDIWSVACVIFELLTSEYLFEPQGQGQLFTKDDDHMAQIIELLGDFPLDAKAGGKYSRELFDDKGALRYIRTLKPWPLKRVLMEKYLYTDKDAVALCSFLEPMLSPDPRNRKEASEMAGHPWMDIKEDEWVEDVW